MAKHNVLGKEGEDIAVKHLQRKGYKIIKRNYRYQRAEIDIIAKKDNVLAAVEVKTRSNAAFGNPQDFVKSAQIERLVMAFDHFINENDLEVEARFDIIGILKTNNKKEVKHIEDAFLFF